MPYHHMTSDDITFKDIITTFSRAVVIMINTHKGILKQIQDSSIHFPRSRVERSRLTEIFTPDVGLCGVCASTNLND